METTKQQPASIYFEKPGVYEILHGQAEPKKYPKPITITGVLSAPFDFLEKKVGNYESKEAFLLVNRHESKLTLCLNAKDHNSADSIMGILTPDEQMQLFGINTDKRWTVRAFVEFLRQRKYFFKNPDQQTKLIGSLQKWSVNIERVIKDHNSNDGNSISSLETKVTGVELVDSFDLEIPVYKGYGKKVFTVKIGVDPKSTSVDLFLYSEDLPMILHSERETLFQSEINKFNSLGFQCSVINLS